MTSSKENKVQLKLDFINDRVNYLRPLPKGKNELIAKAIGIGKGFTDVIDATAGLGMDSVVLARMGCSVRAIERSKEIFTSLDSALILAQVDLKTQNWAKNLKFIHADSIHYLQNLKQNEKPQVIYLDPMFPQKKKSSLPRKEMVLFRSLVGDDTDSEELLQIALKTAKERVVVKRPLKSAPILKEPQHSFEGNSVRYDLYLVSKAST